MTVTTVPVLENDAGPVNAVFSWQLPAASNPGSYAWALLPERLTPGRDFLTSQGTISQPAGPAAEGAIQVPVLPDTLAEEDGWLNLVVRPPGAANWAESMTAPVVVAEFSGGNGTREVLFWREGSIVSRRQNGGISVIETYQRTAAGAMVLTSTLTAPAEAPLLFHQPHMDVSDRAVVVNQPGGNLTWLRDPGAPGGWRRMQDLPFASPGDVRIEGDRLFLGQFQRTAIYRLDPDQPSGWRQTGMLDGNVQSPPLPEYAVVVGAAGTALHERSPGTEDLWNPAYHFPDGTYPRGTCPGMVVMSRGTGLEVLERDPSQSTWAVTGTLPLVAAADEFLVAAPAGDWIAIARVKTPTAPVQGAVVDLFLRDASDRSLWAPAGSLAYPDARHSSSLFWDQGELILTSFRDDNTSSVTARRFAAATARVGDADRDRLSLAAAIQLEPESGTHPAECYAEFPLPVRVDTTVAYAFTGGTAVAGQDYAASAGSTVIPAGSSRARIPVTLLDDDAWEPDKTLGIKLTLTASGVETTGTLVLRDTDAAPVLTASATPLMEGYQSSTVTLRQTAATGSSLSATPQTVEMKVSGFTDPPEGLPLASAGADLPAVSATRLLSATSPSADFAVTATQDTLEEAAEELVSAVWHLPDPGMEAGSYGIAQDLTIPPGNTGPGPGPAAPETAGNQRVAAHGEWIFIVRHPGPPDTPEPTPFPNGIRIDCYRKSAGGAAALEYVQRLNIANIAFQDLSANGLAVYGDTLAVSTGKEQPSGGLTHQLSIFRHTGAATSPWVAEWEWHGPQIVDDYFFPIHRLTDRVLAWGPWLLERSTGPWAWRLANDALINQLDPASTRRVLDTDGRRLVISSPAPGGIVIHRKIHGLPSTWDAGTPVIFSPDGNPENIEKASIEGRTLYLNRQIGSCHAYRENQSGQWQPENGFPGFAFLAAAESSVILRDDPDAKIFARIGPAANPWVQTGTLALHSLMPGSMRVASDASPQQLIYHWQPGGNEPARLRLYEPGLPLAIADDDTLTFEIRMNTSGIPPLTAAESYTGETIKSLKLLMNRQPPIPLSVRVRSVDTGSATSGVDYAPVNYTIQFGDGIGDYGNGEPFSVRIASDRLLEGSETFQLVVDPPVFGRAPAPAVFTITDPAATGMTVNPETTTLFEPVSGSAVQAVEFTLQYAFDRDVAFTASRAVAGIGTQFDFPATPVILPAGSNVLRIPVTVFADALDEGTQSVSLQLTANPPIPGLPAGTTLTILDATVPGLLGDESYITAQGIPLTADGQAGRPAGVQANDPAPPPGGAYLVTDPPSWGSVLMEPDGSFTAQPGPNAIGPHYFGYQVETIPHQKFVSDTAPWKYLHPVNGVNPAVANPAFNTSWMAPAFDDAAWANGSGTMHYGAFNIPVFPNVTTLPTPPSGSRYTSYFRTTFTSATATTVPLRLRLYCDDGAIIYINGVERARATTGTPASSFATAPDGYFLLTGGGQTEAQESVVQTVSLGNVPLHAGVNVLAISLHNLENTSSDLGIRVEFLETGTISETVPVRLTITDGHVPPVTQPDSYTCPQNAPFLSSDAFGPSLLSNDSLVAPDGNFYDPLTEIIISPASAGTVELVGNSGHFRFTPPVDFSGTASFTYQIRDKDGLSASVPVSLMVQPLLPYDLWRQENAGPGGTTLPSSGDADGDGWNNFLEYALFSPPHSPLAATGINAGPGIGLPGSTPVPPFEARLRRAADLAWIVECATSPNAPVWRPLYESRGLTHLEAYQGAFATTGNLTPLAVPLRVAPRTTLQDTPRLFYRVRAERISP